MKIFLLKCFKKHLKILKIYVIIDKQFINRGVAQLVARVVWDHEVAGSTPVTSTNLKDFLRNSRKFQKSLKCEKTHVCKITACVFNFIKFYKILKNTEKISKINFKNYFLSQKNFKKISRIAIPYPIWIRRKFNVNFCTP